MNNRQIGITWKNKIKTLSALSTSKVALITLGTRKLKLLISWSIIQKRLGEKNVSRDQFPVSRGRNF